MITDSKCSYFPQKQNQVKLTWQGSFLRLKGLFDELDCQADKPHNGHPGRWPQSHPVVSEYTRPSEAETFLTMMSKLIFSNPRLETPTTGCRNLSKFRSISWRFRGLSMFHRRRSFTCHLPLYWYIFCCFMLQWKNKNSHLNWQGKT